ncbi:MAG: beta-L-arabinofuranosidase domain-containing protein [Lachnospira sp.]
MVEISFDKLYRYPRLQECADIAVPFKEGELKDIGRIAVLQDGKPCLVQPKVTSRHADGSVRYLFVRFMADLPANEGTRVLLDVDSDLKADMPGTVVDEKADGFFVNLSGMEFSVKNNSSSIFEMVSDGRVIYTADNFEGPYLTDGRSQRYDMQLGEWKVIESGPVCTILSVKGSNVSADKKIDFEIRVTGFAGKPWLDIAYRIINTSDDELKLSSLVFYFKPDKNVCPDDTLSDMHIKSENDSTGCGDTLLDNSANDGPMFHTRGVGELEMLEKKAPFENIRTIVASSNYKTDFLIGRDGTEVNKTVDDKFLIKEANEHYAEVFYGTFMADYTDAQDGVCITVYQAQQNYPKAIKACREGIAVMLVPEGFNDIYIQPGMAKEQRFLMHFHDPSEPIAELDNRSLIYQMPDRPHIAPEVFKESGVMIDIFPEKLDEDVEILLVAKADAHSRCYGLLNWGDTVDNNYTTQGRGNGKPVWSNNEYDYPHSVALMYARTGIRRFLDYLFVSAKHQMDVDVCHYSSDPLRIGGQWEHTAGHCKNAIMVCSHEWVEGLLDYYHFSGDERGLETAVGIGDNVMRLLDTPMYAKPGEANARETGWALRTLVALYVETRDKKWLSKCEWIINSFKVWEEEYGNWLAPYTDNTTVRVGFMISVAVGSVMRYYREFPSEDIKNMLIRAVDDIIENCMLPNGLFYYKELPSIQRNGNNTLLLESLTIAYELTGDTKYLMPGRKTFARAVNEQLRGAIGQKKIVDDAVICGGDGTKGFAQSFIPLITYYNALQKNDISYT